MVSLDQPPESVDRGAPDQAHRAVHDDGVDFVALDHADVEEAGIFGVHGVVHQRAVAVAMVLRRLHEADARIGEQRHQILEPIRRDHIVGIDGADDLRVRGGVGERKPQRAGLVAGQLIDADELEALAERAAMLLDRPPQGRIGRVVDDHHAFEIGIVEPGDGIERRLEHLRRLAIGRNVDRHLGGVALLRRQRIGGEPARARAEGDGRDLLDARQRDGDERQQQDHAEAEREGGAGHEVMALPEGDDGGEPGADEVGRHREHQRLRRGRAADRQDRQRQQQPEQHGEAGALEVVRVGDRPGPGELRLPRGVEQAPIRPDAAFHRLPRLIDRLDDVVVDAIGLGAADEIADQQSLLDAAGIGVVEIVAGARPAELGDHDALAGINTPQLVVDFDGVVDRMGGVGAAPVRQDVRGDEIDRRDELGMVDPGAPDFAGGDRDRARTLHPLDELDEIVDVGFGAQHGLVADDDGVDVAVVAGEFERRANFALVALLVLVDPGADGDLEAEFGRDRRHQLGAAGRGIKADGAGIGGDRLEIGADLLLGRPLAPIGVG